MPLSPLFKTLSWLLISKQGTPGSFTDPQGPAESADFTPPIPLISSPPALSLPPYSSYTGLYVIWIDQVHSCLRTFILADPLPGTQNSSYQHDPTSFSLGLAQISYDHYWLFPDSLSLFAPSRFPLLLPTFILPLGWRLSNIKNVYLIILFICFSTLEFTSIQIRSYCFTPLDIPWSRTVPSK